MIDIVDFRQRMVEARAYTKALFATIEPEDFCHQAHDEFSPVGWHLGHIGVTEVLLGSAAVPARGIAVA